MAPTDVHQSKSSKPARHRTTRSVSSAASQVALSVISESGTFSSATETIASTGRRATDSCSWRSGMSGADILKTHERSFILDSRNTTTAGKRDPEASSIRSVRSLLSRPLFSSVSCFCCTLTIYHTDAITALGEALPILCRFAADLRASMRMHGITDGIAGILIRSSFSSQAQEGYLHIYPDIFCSLGSLCSLLNSHLTAIHHCVYYLAVFMASP